MNTGTMAAREAGNMVDLDSDPTKLIEIVEIGKQLLMTRGALTTFSIANDVAKYFAIIPAMFLSAARALNVMHLGTPQSAILSAIVFNALIIVALIPLALRGVNTARSAPSAVAAAQPPDLRHRRHRRAVRRHQADRHGGHRHGVGVMALNKGLLFSSPAIQVSRRGRGERPNEDRCNFGVELGSISIVAFPLRPFGPPPRMTGQEAETRNVSC